MSSLPPESDEKAIEAFVEAAGDGDLKTVQAYILSGGDIDAQAYAWRQTALVSAVIAGNIDVVDFLILNGADVNRSAGFGVTPLHAAANNNRLEIMEILLSQGGKASINVKDGKGHTALHCARQPKIVELLLKHGADPTIANPSGNTPFSKDKKLGKDDLAELLEQHQKSFKPSKGPKP